ncbi:MAG: hypothetical protein AAFR45_08865 [Pseudomonadota bacterium]
MSADQFLVLGVVLLGLAVPSALTAWAEKRRPRVAALVMLIGGGLIVFAVNEKPGGYTWADVPNAFIGVVADIIN